MQKDSLTLCKLIEKSLSKNKAEEITIIDLKKKTSIADFMIICTGTSNRHLIALSNYLNEELKKLSDLIDWAHSNKLEFHITELDYYNDGENNIFNSVKKQAEVYQKLMDLLQEKSKNGLVTVNFWSMGERISSRGKKGHYMSIYDNDTIPTKTYEVVKKFINCD